MDASNQFGLRKVQRVIATVNKDALGIKNRPHGSVAEQGRVLKPSKEVRSHSHQNTREPERMPDIEPNRGGPKAFLGAGCYNPYFRIQASIPQAFPELPV